MSTKSFTEVRKPGRQPTAEEIKAFEETGRAIAREKKATANAERREAGNVESGEHGNTEIRVSGKEPLQDHRNTQLQDAGLAASRENGDADIRDSTNTETQKAERAVRLTIDLPESVHTRFKAACAISRRKMVEEVRRFIEQRTAELESDSRD